MTLYLNCDSGSFERANTLMESSLQASKDDAIKKSWELSFESRLHFLALVIQEIVLIPLAALYFVFSAIYSFCNWDWEPLKQSSSLCLEKWHHLFVGILGIFAPTASYHCRKYQSQVVASVLGALGLLALAWIMPKPNYIGLSSDGKLKLGWFSR